MSENKTEITKAFNTSLSAEQISMAEARAKKLDIKNEASLENFGDDVQRRLGESSKSMLSLVKTKDADEAGEALAELVKQIQGCDVNQSQFEKIMSKLPVVKNLFNYTNKIITKHKSVENNLDEIVTRLDKSQLSLTKDNANLNILSENNKKYIIDNDINIEAMRIKMREIKNELLPEMEKDVAAHPEDGLKVQELSKLRNIVVRLDKKINNALLFNTAALQSLPRIELIQNGNRQLVDNIKSTAKDVIPMWRSQIAETIALIKQEKVATTQNALYDITNKLLVDNATRSKENTISITKLTERGVIDIETLRKTNREFMTTIDEVIKIREEGARKRLEAEHAIEEIKTELQEKIKSINITTSDTDAVVDTDYTEVSEDDKFLNSK